MSDNSLQQFLSKLKLGLKCKRVVEMLHSSQGRIQTWMVAVSGAVCSKLLPLLLLVVGPTVMVDYMDL